MKILIMGAGVIGVSTAYELVKAGCDVSLVDRQPAAGLETSFANAGEISPGYASPWAGPGVPLKAVQWMLDKHGPLVVHPRLDPLMWRWMLQTLFNCTSRRYALNKSRMVPIAEYSRDCLRQPGDGNYYRVRESKRARNLHAQLFGDRQRLYD